ncbi:Sulfotransferase family protein [Balamuthia mandrillaris]
MLPRWPVALAFLVGFLIGTSWNGIFLQDCAPPERTFPARASIADEISVVKELGEFLDRLRGRPSLPPLSAASSSPLPKVFGLGCSKTGTTSLNEALLLLGIRSDHYRGDLVADLLLHNDTEGPLDVSVDVVHRFKDLEGVTDFPVPYFFEELLHMYPDAKFILTVRDLDTWWPSLKAHYGRRDGSCVREDVYKKKTMVCRTSFARRALTYSTLTANPYVASKAYLRHNKLVQALIPPERLLVMNVEAGDAYSKLCPFLGITACPPDAAFPHANKKPK